MLREVVVVGHPLLHAIATATWHMDVHGFYWCFIGKMLMNTNLGQGMPGDATRP